MVTLRRKGAHVIIFNRPSPRATAAVDSVEKDVPTAVITAIDCDLQKLASGHSAGAALNFEFAFSRVDVLLNNAGEL